ncbi:DAN protein [Trinorchestia longiramus]|nr:DAN protein [Trinorchestia longiramus]
MFAKIIGSVIKIAFNNMALVWALLTLWVLGERLVEGAIIITAGPDPTGRAEVRNMIQNSEQRSWCRPGQIRQIITHANCESKEVENQVCAGSCFSYSLPQTVPLVPGDEELDFCESCQPSQSHWFNITLECTDEDDGFYEVSKRVQQITNCSCSSCLGSRSYVSTVRQESSSAEDSRISDLLSRALPIHEGTDSMQRQETSSGSASTTTSARPPIPILSTVSSGPATLRGVPLGVVTQSPTTTEPGAPSNGDSSLNAVLMQNSGRVPLTLDRSSHYHFPGPYVLQEEIVQHSEDERDPNVLSLADLTGAHDPNPGEDAGLTALMTNLNALLKEEGPAQYQELSLSEIKSLVDNLEPHQARLLTGKTVYSAAPMRERK